MAALVVAHRGYHADAVENTVEAFAAAVELGVDGIELDLQQTADGHLVVHHDDRVGNASIGTLTLADLRAGLPEKSCPLLEDVMAPVGDAVCLDIEVKQVEPARVARALEQVPRAVLSSFDTAVLCELAALAPETRRGLVVEAGGRDDPSALIERAAAASAHFLALDIRLAGEETLEAIADRLGPSYVWTVNDEPQLVRLLADERVAAVITDRPDLALRLRPQPAA